MGINSSSTRVQIVSIGIAKPIIAYRTENRLLFVVGPDGGITLQDTTPGNDPALVRNSSSVDDIGPPPRRIWY